MTLIQLHNRDWAYETNCFVCEPTNSAGLQIPFFHDDETASVVADFELSNAYSGAPTLIHGGITLAVLDEAMAWACIAIGHRWAVTSETTTRFERGLNVERPYRVIASITEQGDEQITTAATIVFTPSDGRPRTCATASATFTVLGEAQVQRLAGDSATPVDTSYTKDT